MLTSHQKLAVKTRVALYTLDVLALTLQLRQVKAKKPSKTRDKAITKLERELNISKWLLKDIKKYARKHC